MASIADQLLPILVMFALASLFSSSAKAQLQVGYYRDRCIYAEEIVRQEVASVLSVDPYQASALLRLHFHDCFVRGCDGSILLDSTDDSMDVVEKDSETSAGLRGFHIIDRIKEKLEEACPGIVSCADILALVARDAVVFLSDGHGPQWDVPTGRLDGRISRAVDTKDLPPPDSDIAQLQAAFAEKNLTTKDLVVLSAFRDRLLNGSTSGGGGHNLNEAAGLEALDPAYQKELRSECGANPEAAVQMSPKSSPRFDTRYYSNVARRRGLFRSDATLLADGFTSAYVEKHATGLFDAEFFDDFGVAMVNMGSIQPATTEGEVRTKCSVVN